MKIRLPLILLLFMVSVSQSLAIDSEEKEFIRTRIVDFDQRVPKIHPRLMIVKNELPQFRDFLKRMLTQKEYPDLTKKIILKPQNVALPDEPEIPNPKDDPAKMKAVWRKGYETAFKAASTAQRYAFSYLYTGDTVYGREAARWLMHIAGWDIHGGIDIKHNDESFIQSLRPMLYAYDWVYDCLTPDERQKIQKHLGIRLEILYKHVTSKFSLLHPTPPTNSLSHPMRFISTLGVGGVVLYHDLPEGPKYLAWAYEYYRNQFPVWGGADGGWSEGLNYWQTATNQHFQFYDAMQTIGTVEFLNRDFYRNNGYFGIYNLGLHPFSSFGDLCNIIGPSQTTFLIMDKYALLFKDPYLARCAGLLHTGYPSGVNYYTFSYFDSIFHLYRKGQTEIPAVNLNDLPRSRWFKDIGWVAFHSQLGEPDDIMLGFKSSPFGSASHSFSDQNSFVINAFGEPLAISSGYREWYGSPHHLGWTRTTLSKNAVVFDGKSQPIRDALATGKITRFFTGDNLDFATGDALGAWGNIGVKQALRQVLFVNRRYFLILDELEADQPVTYQWLLHARSQMTFNQDKSEVVINQGRASLLTKFLDPSGSLLRFRQTDRFTVPPHPDFVDKMPNEWHFTADAFQPRKSQTFLTWLYPYRNQDKNIPEISQTVTDNGYDIRVRSGDAQERIIISGEKKRKVLGDGVEFAGLAGVISKRAEQVNGFGFIEGTVFKTADILVTSDKPLSFEAVMVNHELKLTWQLVKETKTNLQIRMNFKPTGVMGLSEGQWQYLSGEKTLKLHLTENGSAIIR